MPHICIAVKPIHEILKRLKKLKMLQGISGTHQTSTKEN